MGEIAFPRISREGIYPQIDKKPKAEGHPEVLLESAGMLLREVVTKTLQLVQSGDFDPAEKENWINQYINETKKQEKAIQDRWQNGEQVFPYIPLKAKDIAELPANLAYSLVNLGSSIIAGMAGTTASYGNPIVGKVIMGATSLITAKRLSKNDYKRMVYDTLKETVGEDKVNELWEKAEKQVDELGDKYGIWEAVPETVGNLLMLDLYSAMFGKKTGLKILVKLLDVYGGEVLTETITQMGQHNVEVKSGIGDGHIRKFDDILDITQSFKEVFPQTVLLTTVMAGGGAVASKVYGKITEPIREKKAAKEFIQPKLEEFHEKAGTLRPENKIAFNDFVAEKNIDWGKIRKNKKQTEKLYNDLLDEYETIPEVTPEAQATLPEGAMSFNEFIDQSNITDESLDTHTEEELNELLVNEYARYLDQYAAQQPEIEAPVKERGVIGTGTLIGQKVPLEAAKQPIIIPGEENLTDLQKLYRLSADLYKQYKDTPSAELEEKLDLVSDQIRELAPAKEVKDDTKIEAEQVPGREPQREAIEQAGKLPGSIRAAEASRILEGEKQIAPLEVTKEQYDKAIELFGLPYKMLNNENRAQVDKELESGEPGVQPQKAKIVSGEVVSPEPAVKRKLKKPIGEQPIADVGVGAKPTPGVSKQPWEMTKKESISKVDENYINKKIEYYRNQRKTDDIYIRGTNKPDLKEISKDIFSSLPIKDIIINRKIAESYGELSKDDIKVSNDDLINEISDNYDIPKENISVNKKGEIIAELEGLQASKEFGWENTLSDYIVIFEAEDLGYNPQETAHLVKPIKILETIPRNHKNIIQQALSEGKIPYKGWQNDYPELARTLAAEKPKRKLKKPVKTELMAGRTLPEAKPDMLDMFEKFNEGRSVQGGYVKHIWTGEADTDYEGIKRRELDPSDFFQHDMANYRKKEVRDTINNIRNGKGLTEIQAQIWKDMLARNDDMISEGKGRYVEEIDKLESIDEADKFYIDNKDIWA
ncbi:MAG: hypothetical protein ABIJ59_15300, partial [Pseudomonadota bacterium]